MAKKKGKKGTKKEKHNQSTKIKKFKRITQKQHAIFYMLMFLIPVLFFVLLECLLSLIHYGGHLKLVQEFSINPAFYQLNSEIGKKYFPRYKFATAVSNDLFYKDKKKNTYRIFVVGGSSAAGYPYMNNGAFSRMLRTRLQAQFPESHIEIVNTAMPAVNTFTLLDFVKELVHYQPDAFLIYAGHNEFYGALGVGSTETIGNSRAFIKLFLKLQNCRTFLLIRNLMLSLKNTFVYGTNSSVHDEATIMERMVGKKEIAYRNDTYYRALQFFRSNLDEIIKIAKKHDVDIIISELVSNVKDQKPFVSLFKDEQHEENFRQIISRGFAQQQKNQFQLALEHYYKAKSIDDSPAIVYYRIAQCYEQLAQYDSAKAYYYKSKDMDGLRFRASEDFNEVIRDVCQQHHIPYVPLLNVFESRSFNELIGDNLMLDHLHPNAEGYFLIAKSFSNVMQQRRLIHLDWNIQQSPSDSLLLTKIGLTEIDYQYAQLAVNILKAGWPFKPAGTVNEVLHAKPKTDLEGIARKWLLNEYNWEQVHVLMAEYNKQNRFFDKAADEYLALVIGTPFNEFPYLQLAEIKIAQKKYDEAFILLDQSLELAETAYANKWVGVIKSIQAQPKEAIVYLERAYKLDPSDEQTLSALSSAYRKIGNYEKALDVIKELAVKNPDYPGLKQYIEELITILGSVDLSAPKK